MVRTEPVTSSKVKKAYSKIAQDRLIAARPGGHEGKGESMKNEKYVVFFNGRFWGSFPSNASAYREKKNLRKIFSRENVIVRKVTAP